MAAPRRRWRCVCALAAGLAACAPTGEQAVSQNELLARSLMDALVAADTATIVALFWPEAVYDDYASQLQYRGIEEIVGYVTSVHAWADDVYLNVGSVHVSESGAVAEWLFAAVQARPMGELVPTVTNREVVVNGVTIIEVDGGRIRRAADYVDQLPLLLQLGGRMTLPGGGLVELEEGR
ncbi:MAG: nuclear transport factor 2 family protein [Gemmatimonadetes bacterium]|nr:nuclear transport factor 2 family protein [Gemmatimonadota bacterium]